MKKILIFSHAMELGGAERALLGLLEAFNLDQYSVDLFLMRHEGPLMEFIPSGVHVLDEIGSYTALGIPLKSALLSKEFRLGLRRLYGKIKAKNRVKKLQYPSKNSVALEYSHKYTVSAMPQISPDIEYDLAISFLTPHYFVAEKVRAKKKIAWIHTDYSNVLVDIESERKMWNRYDNIISISDKTTDGFLHCFPELKYKICVIENIQPVSLIEQQKKEFNTDQEMPRDSIRLLSVGRFAYAKNFDNIPQICKKIRESGLNVKWYLIGYGSDEALIRKKIREAEMEQFVIILGKKVNPYPYICACDLYVQPSRFEGNCVSVREAQMLGKPVVITAYPTSASQLEDGVDGLIVPMNNEACASGIINLLNHPNQLKQMELTCQKRNYSNTGQVEKLRILME